VNVVRRGRSESDEELRVARFATVALGLLAIALGISLEGQNVAFMVALAFAIAASANFPALVLAIFWSRLSTAGAVASMVTGTLSTVLLIWLSPTVQLDVLGNPSAWFPLKNPALVTIPLSFAAGIGVSLLRPEPAAAVRYRALARQMHLGHDAE
jgi:cation/acetate symporter